MKTARDGILALQDGWGKDAMAKAFDVAFVNDVFISIERIMKWCTDSDGVAFQPEVSPTEENSIDVLWERGKFRMLVNYDGKSREADIRLWFSPGDREARSDLLKGREFGKFEHLPGNMLADRTRKRPYADPESVRGIQEKINTVFDKLAKENQ
jgi:hypothetical protein